MKQLSIFLVILFVSSSSFAQKKKSPKLESKGKIGSADVEVIYSAPSVKGRTIWGELEKYDKVWRAGANENTTVSFSKDVKIDGKKLAAGKYGFFIIPKKGDTWTVIFNKKNDAWGAYDYKESEDALRVEVPVKWDESVQEQLKYSVEGNGIDFAWAKARLNIPVKG